MNDIKKIGDVAAIVAEKLTNPDYCESCHDLAERLERIRKFLADPTTVKCAYGSPELSLVRRKILEFITPREDER